MLHFDHSVVGHGLGGSTHRQGFGAALRRRRHGVFTVPRPYPYRAFLDIPNIAATNRCDGAFTNGRVVCCVTVQQFTVAKKGFDWGVGARCLPVLVHAWGDLAHDSLQAVRPESASRSLRICLSSTLQLSALKGDP